VISGDANGRADMQIYRSAHDRPLLDWQWLEPSLRNITRLILKHTPAGGGRALDVGCGTGRIAFRLVDRGYQVDGIDIEPRVIELALRMRESGQASTCTFRVGDYRDPDEVTPGHYDLIVCSEVLEHVEDYRAIVANMYRALKPRGRLIVTVPYDMRKFSTLDRYAGHLRRFDRDVLLRDLSAFRTTKLIVTGFPFYRLMMRTYLLAARLRGCEHSNETLWARRSTRILARLTYPFVRADNWFAFTGLGDALIAISDK
jgi:SAM-dependent methyltransferase